MMKATDLNFKDIIDLLPVYLSIQNRELEILFANRTFKNDFGYVISKHCYEVYKGSTNPCQSCPVQKTFKDKKVHFSEETIRTRDGKESRIVAYSAPILDKRGNVISVMKLSTNITEVKTMQKELSALGQSVAFMSHGIKNILEGLQGGSYVVDEGIHDGDIELVKRGWSIVKNNITDISGIVQNILYSSKKRSLRFEKVSPCAIIKDPVNLFKEKALAMNIKLKHEANPALPPVNLDPVFIRRMLNNLVSNAMEACAKDKDNDSNTIVVRAEIYNEFQFMFEVEDNGIGMDEATRKKIFKEFFSTKGAEGTGLGMTVVDKIVKEHKGKIEVESTSGEGSIFRVILMM